MASSCCSCFPSSPSSISRLLLPLHDRFTDIPEPMRSQMIGASIKIMQDNIMEIANCNRMHGLGWGGVGPRCRACAVELSRAVKAVEGAGVQVEEEYTSLLADLQAQEDQMTSKEESPCDCRRKRQREREDMEEKEREFKRYCRDSMLAYMTSLEEEEAEEEEEDDEDDEEGESEEEEEILEIYD